MQQFKNIELNDKKTLQPYITASNSNSSPSSFANMYIWDPAYPKAWAIISGFLVVRFLFTEGDVFAFPAGSGNIKECVNILKDYSASRGNKLSFLGLTKDNVDALTLLFPDEFEITSSRNAADYIYSAEKLASLSGKKLHGKRNHIHRFEELGLWSFVPIDENNLSECIKLKQTWSEKAKDERNIDASEEKCALNRAFDNYKALDFDGGILYLNENIVAFTIGSRLNSNTFDVNFEKALADIPGAFSMINREFVRYILKKYPEIEYINREDDMGLENLRKAKLSYYPEILLEKYTAVLK